jgi:hypothetical protein
MRIRAVTTVIGTLTPSYYSKILFKGVVTETLKNPDTPHIQCSAGSA